MPYITANPRLINA